MKHIFEEPSIEVVKYVVNNVIATSPIEEVDYIVDPD